MNRKYLKVGLTILALVIILVVGARLEQSPPKDTLYIKPAYGAGTADYYCDGTADDIQILAAIATLPAVGGKIVILAGTYSLSATVNINKANVSITGMGDSTRINLANVVNGDMFYVTANGFNLSNVYLYGNRAGQAAASRAVEYAGGASYSTISNVLFQNTYGSAVYILGGSYKILIDNVRVDDCSTIGTEPIIYFAGAFDSEIRSSRFTDTRTITGVGLAGNTISNCVFDGIGHGNIYAGNGAKIYGNTFSNADDAPITIDGGASNVDIIGNRSVDNPDFAEIRVTADGQTQRDINIIGNQISGSFAYSSILITWAAGSPPAATQTHIVISGNTIVDGVAYAIESDWAIPDYITVTGNTFRNNTLGDISLPGTHNVIENNNTDLSEVRSPIFDNLMIVPTNAYWDASNTGLGGGGHGLTNLDIYTGITASSRGMFTTTASNLSAGQSNLYRVNWDKKLYIAFNYARYDSDAEVVSRFQLKQASTEGALAALGLGIQVDNLAISGESYGTSGATVSLSTTLTVYKPVHIVIILYPGKKIEWYVDGVLKGTQSTAGKIPSGNAGATNSFVFSIVNGGTGTVDAHATLGQITIWQDW